MTPQELRERYCKSIGLDTNYRKFDDPYSQWLESYLASLTAQRDRAWEVLKNLLGKPAKMQEMLKANGFVFDNLDDRWQKLAFTLYTEICSTDSTIGQEIESIEEDK